jgi:hypothetical protein
MGAALCVKTNSLTLEGRQYSLLEAQRDTIPFAPMNGYNEIQDESGQTFAIFKDNKCWILIDVIHRLGDSSSYATEQWPAVLQAVFSQIVQPITPEERQALAEKKIVKQIFESAKDNFGNFKAQRDAFAKDAESYQRNLLETLRQLTTYESLLKNMANYSEDDARKVLDKIKSLPFFESLSCSGGTPIVNTKEIQLGPLNYGKFTMYMINYPKMTHEAKAMHPYEFHDHNEFCIGGFASAYTQATHSGEYDKAFMILRMLITNFSTSTRMNSVEEFLQSSMGKRGYEKAIKELCEQAKIPFDDYDVAFSSILGNEITLLATRKPDKKGEQTLRKVIKV